MTLCHYTSTHLTFFVISNFNQVNITETRMWANANAMVALQNIRGALCSMPQSLADAHYYMPCSNDAKTRKPLKVAGVPQPPETISAASGPKFTILWAHVEEILLLNKIFSDCRYMP